MLTKVGFLLLNLHICYHKNNILVNFLRLKWLYTSNRTQKKHLEIEMLFLNIILL